MTAILWFLLSGGLLVLMALGRSHLERLPLSTSLLYLLVGIGIGPAGLGLLRLDPFSHADLLERLSEVAVIISLFTSGLKLRAPLSDPIWRSPLRLASLAMIVTVGLLTAVGVGWLALPLGAAVLLGAVLAPTDPVLASDVQVERPSDQDRLRFGLTGEAGLNDDCDDRRLDRRPRHLCHPAHGALPPPQRAPCGPRRGEARIGPRALRFSQDVVQKGPCQLDCCSIAPHFLSWLCGAVELKVKRSSSYEPCLSTNRSV